MRFLETIRSVMTTDGIEGTLTETLVRHIEESNPSLRLKRARLVMGDGKGFNLIDRSGILYFVKPPYEVLNPYCGAGTGLQLVKGSNSDPTGVYLTRNTEATDEERYNAMKAYLYVLGVPRSNLLVLPATCWPSTYEHTPENVAALAEAGALLIHE